MPCSRSPPAASIFTSRSWDGYERKDRVTMLGGQMSIYTPEAASVQRSGLV